MGTACAPIASRVRAAGHARARAIGGDESASGRICGRAAERRGARRGAANVCEARHVPELPRGLRWLMNTFAIATLLWAYCAYAWITHSGIWQLVMEVMRPMQKAVPDSQAVAITAWGFGLGAMLVVAWPLSLILRRR